MDTGAMNAPTQPARPVDAWPCQSICVWARTDEVWVADAGGVLHVFRCTGCSSEWVRTEAWTPVDADGRVPPDVVAERGLD